MIEQSRGKKARLVGVVILVLVATVAYLLVRSNRREDDLRCRLAVAEWESRLNAEATNEARENKVLLIDELEKRLASGQAITKDFLIRIYRQVA